MTPTARKWLATWTAVLFATTGLGAYAHLALHPHRYCPEHGQFEPREDDPFHAAHVPPRVPDRHGPRLPGDHHPTCPEMAFATTPLEVAASPAPLPAPAPFALQALRPPNGPRIARVAAFRLAPKTSPPA